MAKPHLSPGQRAAYKLENLERAWLWIRTNPEVQTKNHFRRLYSAYSIADTTLLKDLKSRLDRGIFTPSRSCKLFVPKPSGILRPFSLLAIEDQIVYQAMANVVAERVVPHVRHHYNKKVFGHQYAGIASNWFYRRWSDGYRAFNEAAESVFKAGYVWGASFDLTAFYDSIDHGVLRHKLEEFGLDAEFCLSLTELLNRWTATERQIFHNHGIPQGPLSSGMISEAILSHFDENFRVNFDVKYFRYVDDIRLFAKSETHLRHGLLSLDRLSKDIGLFPQSSKIDIHRVVNIRDELKTVSSPPEPALSGFIPDQSKIRTRLAELAPRSAKYKVADPTRFKYLLAHAEPSLLVLNRLWRVFEHAPHFIPQLGSYLEKFDSLPDNQGARLLHAISSENLYSAIQSRFIQAQVGRLSPPLDTRAKKLLKPMWKLKANPPELSLALWDSLQHLKHFTDKQTDYALLNAKPSWLRMQLHYGVAWKEVADARRVRLLNQSIRDQSADVAITGAWLIALLNVRISTPTTDVNPAAKTMLRTLGKMRVRSARICGIRTAIAEMTGADIPVNWRRLLGSYYNQAESQMVTCRGYYKTDPTAWVNMLDVFNDLFAEGLFKRDGSIGQRNLGDFGGILTNKKLETKFPLTHKYFVESHNKRLESQLSHAVVKKTKAPTGKIPYKWLKRGSQLLRDAAREVRAAGH